MHIVCCSLYALYRALRLVFVEHKLCKLCNCRYILMDQNHQKCKFHLSTEDRHIPWDEDGDSGMEAIQSSEDERIDPLISVSSGDIKEEVSPPDVKPRVAGDARSSCNHISSFSPFPVLSVSAEHTTLLPVSMILGLFRFSLLSESLFMNIPQGFIWISFFMSSPTRRIWWHRTQRRRERRYRLTNWAEERAGAEIWTCCCWVSARPAAAAWSGRGYYRHSVYVTESLPSFLRPRLSCVCVPLPCSSPSQPQKEGPRLEQEEEPETPCSTGLLWQRQGPRQEAREEGEGRDRRPTADLWVTEQDHRHFGSALLQTGHTDQAGAETEC